MNIFFQYFSDIAQNPETNQRPPSFIHSLGYLPGAAALAVSASNPASTGLYSRENSPYSEFVNNGPTRIAMPYRVPGEPSKNSKIAKIFNSPELLKLA